MKDMLANIAQKSIGLDKDKLIEEYALGFCHQAYMLKRNFHRLTVGPGNGGSKVTSDLKLQVKLGRQNSIHFTPTVLLDGLVDPSVSSSFTKDDWTKYVQEKLN